MVHIALCFAPFASPTYVPLGMASLAALKQGYQGAEVSLLDLNCVAWHTLAQRSPQGEAVEAFMQGRAGNFFDPAAYSAMQPSFQQLYQMAAELTREVREGLSTGNWSTAALSLLEPLCDAIVQVQPTVVAFSVLYPGQLVCSVALAALVRDVLGPQVAIVFGGASMSALECDELAAACPWIDAVIQGEGEVPFGQLLAGGEVRELAGAVIRQGDSLVHTPRPPIVAMHSLPIPDYSMLPSALYFNPTPVVALTMSRGCKWRRCRFCAHNKSYGRYRPLGAERFVAMVEQVMARTGAHHFYLSDQYVDAQELGLLADALKAAKLPIAFQVMARPTADYTPALLETIAAAGCVWISWGVESGSQRLLDLVDKGTSPATIRRVVTDAHAAGISNLAMMLFGLPGSTESDVEQTWELLDALYDKLDACTASSFVLFDHTPFAQQAARYGIEPLGREELFSTAQGSVHSHRLDYREYDEQGRTRPLRGAYEVSAWERRRQWYGEVPFLEQLASEHYLLYASRKDRRVHPLS